jgi:DNA invertase Pin-like site-specific DNA recombinase
MKIFYLRVSTAEQNLDRQRKLAKEEKAEKIFEEKISGKDTNRPELQKMLDFCREGDIVCVESISRLARSTKDLLNIVDKLSKKEVGFISYKEDINTTTAQGRFILTIFAALAELEREQTLQRQREGIEIAKAKGKYKGKQKKKFDEKKMEELYPVWKRGEITAVIFMNRLNLKPNTFYRRIKEFEEERGVS